MHFLRLRSNKGSAHIYLGAPLVLLLLIIAFVILWLVANPLAQEILAAIDALSSAIRG